MNKIKHIIISDIHGCYYEFKTLLKKLNFKIENNSIISLDNNQRLILNGDLFDKNNDCNITKTLILIYNTIVNETCDIILIKGNHDLMNYRFITDDPTLELTEKRLKEKELFYSTSIILENSDKLKKYFLSIYDKMIPFYESDDFICTHSPCETKHLGKFDNQSIKLQIKSASRSKNKDKSLDELNGYLIEEANNNDKLHIFGHLGQDEVRRYKNKICIDTGCVYGKKLTAIIIEDGKIDYSEVKARETYTRRYFHHPLFSFLDEERNHA